MDSNRWVPLIEDLIEKMGQHTIFSVIDMADGYHQVPIREQDRHLAAFCTPTGTYEWTVMPMGLVNAGATFQRVMHKVLKPLGDSCDCYIDDALCGSSGKDEIHVIHTHYKDLDRMITQLEKHDLYGS